MRAKMFPPSSVPSKQGEFKPSRKANRASAIPSPSVSRSRVSRLALLPSAFRRPAIPGPVRCSPWGSGDWPAGAARDSGWCRRKPAGWPHLSILPDCAQIARRQSGDEKALNYFFSAVVNILSDVEMVSVVNVTPDISLYHSYLGS